MASLKTYTSYLGATLCVLIALGCIAHAQNRVFLSTEEIEELRKGSACSNLVKQFFALQKKMAAQGVETDFFDLRVIPTDELLRARRGKYYAVYLKDTAAEARFKFPGGRYVIPDFKNRFRRAMTAFVRSTLGVIEGAADYELYVRGSSSNSPMSVPRSLVDGHRYDEIDFYPQVSDNLYDETEFRTRDVPETYTNEDLPLLRAAFLSDVVERFYPLKKPRVLESRVSTTNDPNQQFAEIILYVDW